MSHKIYQMQFGRVYPLYIQKAERKNRTKAEVNHVISWLTGYEISDIEKLALSDITFESFFNDAPMLHPNRDLIKGLICGIRVEEIIEPLMQNIRYLDKLIDELAKGKSMDKILRK